MTILVDGAVWSARGRRWAHLVSDHSFDELHAFAGELGLPPRAFHRDHYDLPDEWRDRAIELGAQPVDPRELVRRLRAAGLRRRPGSGRGYTQEGTEGRRPSDTDASNADASNADAPAPDAPDTSD